MAHEGYPLCSSGSKTPASPGDRAEEPEGWERTKSMEPSGVKDRREAETPLTCEFLEAAVSSSSQCPAWLWHSINDC